MEVNTKPVRRAIVVFTHRQYGIYHDDFDYSRLNNFLPMIHKVYLKKLVCYPERLTKNDYLRIRNYDGFSFADMAHYALIVMEGRRIGELHYLINAVNEFHQKSSRG